MPEPRSHYQISLTARQAFSLFLGLLLALGLAFFLGVRTGLEDSEEPPDTSPAETGTPVAEGAAPAEAEPVAARPNAAGTETGGESPSRTSIALFEDRGGGEPEPSPTASSPGAPAGSLWVQVLSLSSRSEAETRSVQLAARGHRVAVMPGRGPRGPVFRVRVGPFSTRREAASAAERISREEKTETWIVPDGQ
jgi:DedD protein